LNDIENILTSGQLRAARALLGWTAQRLADASGVGVATIRRAELKEDVTGMGMPIVQAIRNAFDTAGVEFTNGGQPGVRMKARRA